MREIENPMMDSDKKKKRALVISIIVLCLLYIVFAAKPLSREIHFVPVWTIDADNSTRTNRISDAASEQEKSTVEGKSADEKQQSDERIPFKMGQLAGYFTKNGALVSRVTFPYKAAVSSDFYALYETHSEAISVYSSSGEKITEISDYGFPFFDGGKIYLFLPGGCSFSRISLDGKTLWSYDGHSPITAFSSSENGILAGYADGQLIAFDFDGNVLFKFEPGGSAYPVILGAGVSNSGNLVAAISGRDKQRFILAEKKNDNANIVFYKYFEKEVTNQMIVKFNKTETAVYYSCAGGLGVLNCKTFKDSLIPITGTILSIQEDDDGTIFVLSKDENYYSVSVVETFDIHSGSFSFEASTAFMVVKKGSLFIGYDSKISRIDIEHK